MANTIQAPATDPPSVDLTRLADWFQAALPGAGPPLSARLLAGGRSNLTYEIQGSERAWVLRRPPLGHVLPGTHDVGREHRVMAALAGTRVPVPATYALCLDRSVIGAPFYLMEKVDGRSFRSAAELARLGPERTRAISLYLIEALTDLHDVDPAAVGLSDFGRAEGFLERQVRRWSAQLAASSGCVPPAADRLRDRLASGIPAPSAPRIVHGDYRLDNVLIGSDDRPAAVIDWEMATVGDPLTDLALLIVYQRLSRLSDVVSDVGAAPGYLTEDEVTDRYFGRSGREPAHFGFYLGLAAYKLAVIAEGIHHRDQQGLTVEAGLGRIGALTEPLLQIGLAAVRKEN